MRIAASLVLALSSASCSVGWGWGPDPDAANIVPNTAPGAPRIITRAPPNSLTPGVEGSILFVRLIGPDGAIVLDRAFDWPSDEQAVPPGEYRLVAYWRVCNGTCANLSGESEPVCEEAVSLARNDRAVMDIVPRELMPGSECSVEIKSR